MWLDEQRSRVSARSRLGEKLTYIANQWDGLLVFLYDGRVEIDSNAVENLMRAREAQCQERPVRRPRRGGARLGTHRLADRNLQAQWCGALRLLKSTLEKIAAGHPQSRIRELLPWAYNPASN